MIEEAVQVQINSILEKCKDIQPFVAIKCITYNQEGYIRQALEGFVMQQTKFPFVAIVHDDASTDRTALIIKEYADKYPDIILPIFEKENLYSKGGFYKIDDIISPVLKDSDAKYIALCEGDDYWTDPLKLQKQVDFMEKNPDFSMCWHSVNIFDSSKNCIDGAIIRYPQNQIVNVGDVIIKGGPFIPTLSIFFRSKFIDDYPLIAQTHPFADYPLQLYLSLKGKTYYMKDIMGIYRINSSNSWSSIPRSLYVEYKLLLQNERLLNYFDDYTEFKFHKYFCYKLTLNKNLFILYNNVRKRIFQVKPQNWNQVKEFLILFLGLTKYRKQLSKLKQRLRQKNLK